MCVDMRVDMRVEMCAEMCADMCADMCVNMACVPLRIQSPSGDQAQVMTMSLC